MFKKAVCFILISFFIFPSLRADAFMTHEKFVHLSNDQKDELIIKTMEMMVELESAYEKDVALYGLNEETHQKYTSIMNRLAGLVMSEAYAADPKTPQQKWKEYSDTFMTGISANSGKNNKCFFGGWPSRTVDKELTKYQKEQKDLAIKYAKQQAEAEAAAAAGTAPVNPADLSDDEKAEAEKAALPKTMEASPVVTSWGKKSKKEIVTLCMHPSQLEKNAPERKGYEARNNNECKSGAHGSTNPQISCNPAIFGFKNADKGTAFCVDSSSLKVTQNSAHLCMKKALGIGEKPEPDADSPEKRKAAMRAALEGNGAHVDKLYGFLMKSCVCGADTKFATMDSNAKKLDKTYIDRIKPHRTCYGMMEMMADTMDCPLPGSSLDTRIFTLLKKHTDSPSIHLKNGKSPQAAEEIDNHYSEFLKKLKDKPEYKVLCNNDTKYKCEVTPCKEVIKLGAKEGSRTYTCEVNITDEYRPEIKEAGKPITGVEGKFVKVNTKDGKSTMCEIPKGEKPKEYICSTIDYKSCSPVKGPANGKAPSLTCDATVVEKEDPSKVASAVFKVTGAPGQAAKEQKQKLLDGHEAKVTCTLPEIKPKEKSKCGIEISGDPDAIAKAQFIQAEKDEISEYIWNGANPTANSSISKKVKPGEEWKVSLKLIIKREDGEIYEVQCPDKVRPASKVEDPKLIVTPGKDTDTTQEALGEVKGELGDVWSVKWYKTIPGKSVGQELANIALAGKPVEGTSATDKAEDLATEELEITKEKKSARTESRGKEPFNICAKLVKEGGELPGGCVAVKPLEEKAAPAPTPAKIEDRPRQSAPFMPLPMVAPIQRDRGESGVRAWGTR